MLHGMLGEWKSNCSIGTHDRYNEVCLLEEIAYRWILSLGSAFAALMTSGAGGGEPGETGMDEVSNV